MFEPLGVQTFGREQMHSNRPMSKPGRAWSEVASRLGLGAILLAFVLLGVLYSVRVPLFETPDEPLHYRYVRWLVRERKLPPLVASQDEWLQGEFHQPPLYYVLSALLTGGIEPTAADLAQPDPTMAVNPYAMRGLPHVQGNKNAMLHVGDPNPPYTGVALVVHLLRWLGILISTVTLWFVFRIARQILPSRRGMALLATAVTAFNPQFVFASAAVNNDTLVVLLSTVTLYMLVQVIQGQARTWPTPLMLGATIGLAGLTKLSGLALAALVPMAYYGHWRQQPQRSIWRDLVRPVLIVAAVSLLLCGWWYVRNQLRYGDLLGMRSYRQIFGVFAEPLSWLQSLILLSESFVSYWGVFGWMNVLADEAYYLVMRIVCLAALGGLALTLLSGIQRRARRKETWYPLALLAVWILIMLAMLLRWTQSITRTQGRLLFPAVAGISLFLALGLSYWFSEARASRTVRRLSSLGLVLGLLGMSVIAPFRYIQPAYALPQIMSLESVPDTLQGLDIAFGDELVLLGYELPQDQVVAGETLSLRLYWLCRARMQSDYTFYVHLFGHDEARIGKLDTYPGMGNYPTSTWAPGQVIADDYAVAVDPFACTPLAAEVRVGVYQGPELVLLEARDLQGRPVSPAPTIGRVRIMPRVATTYRPANTSGAVLGDRVMLIGSSFDNSAQAGETLPVTVYWRCLAPMSVNYTVFMHLVDAQGAIVTQVDSQPQQGDFPTHYWAEGQEIKDEHQLVLPHDLAAGEYELRAGLYLVETSERLPILNVPSIENALSLGSIRVAAEPMP